MSQKKRGLGRGLGALIPSSPESDRPVDVFFSGGGDKDGAGTTTAVAAPASDVERDDAEAGQRSKARTASWDSAIAGGRLSIRTKTAEPSTAWSGDSAATGGVTTVEGEAAPGESEATEHAVVSATGDASRSDLAALGVTTSIAVTGGSTEDPVTALPSEGSMTEGAGSERDTVMEERTEGSEAGTREEHKDASGQAQPDDVSRETDLVPVPGARFVEVPVDSIRPNSRQPRTVFDEGDLDELVDSISQIGVLQPIVVRPDPELGDRYELIMGERRWRASQEAGLTTIPAIVRETDDSDMLRDALLENLHRAALNPLEEAAAYRQLLDDFGCTHEQLAARIARSRPQISNTLRLLRLPPLVQRRVAAGVLSAGHARALLGLTDGAEIERLAQRIVSEGLSVRATEEIVTLLTSGDGDRAARRSPRAGQRSEAMDELASRLSDHFETRVKVNLGKNKGRLTMEFASVEDLNRILEVMAPEDPGLLRP
jgi:ParB family transcriptional regulator, chromosome partitioning protein